MMDLYEALKAGTTEEELLKAFHKDLDEASARLKEERKQEEAAKSKLTEQRNTLAKAILDYAKAYFNEDWLNDISTEDVIADISKIEESWDQCRKTLDNIQITVFPKQEEKRVECECVKNDSYTQLKDAIKSDQDIIDAFLKTLR